MVTMVLFNINKLLSQFNKLTYLPCGGIFYDRINMVMKMKTVVLNAKKMNYDGLLDFSILGDEVITYEDTDESKMLERIQDVDVVVTKEMKVSRDTILQFPKSVKLLCEAGTGYNNIDLMACKERNIPVCNVPAYSSQRVAQTAIMLLLNLNSTMQRQISMLAKGDKSNFTDYLQVSHIEVNDKTLGVIGYGNIGKEVVKIGIALGMHILVYTRTPKEDNEFIHFVSLEELLKQSDFVSLHCPLNEKTYHMINENTLKYMKSSAFLINTSRGSLIDEKALVEALKNKQIAGAGLDVLEVEPAKEDNPLFALENVILTPHMGWKGLETRQRLVSILSSNIQSFFTGKPQNRVG